MIALRPLHSFPLRLLRRLLSPLRRWLAKAGTGNPRWATVYYALCDPAFAREQMAFLAGQRAYYASVKAPSGTMAVLRRNVHRLEKGLLMRPRRVPFATDYIGETVDAFCHASQGNLKIDSAEQAWAFDVLTEYFKVHSAEEEIGAWREKFRGAGAPGQCEPASMPRIPYQRDLSRPPAVTYSALFELAKRRRSVRWFLQKPVDRTLIDSALEIGAQAPSACNRQPFEFRIFDDPSLIQAVMDIPYGLVGYSHNVPVIAVVVGQQRHYFGEHDRHLIYIDASLAVMGFLLALETNGLSSCCVNWPDIEEKESRMAKLLKLGADERPIMLIAIGHPDPEGMVANSTKKSLALLRRYNFE